MEERSITEMDGIAGITTGILLLFLIGVFSISDIVIVNNNEAFLYALLAISLAVAVRGIWNTWKEQ